MKNWIVSIKNVIDRLTNDNFFITNLIIFWFFSIQIATIQKKYKFDERVIMNLQKICESFFNESKTFVIFVKCVFKRLQNTLTSKKLSHSKKFMISEMQLRVISLLMHWNNVWWSNFLLFFRKEFDFEVIEWNQNDDFFRFENINITVSAIALHFELIYSIKQNWMRRSNARWESEKTFWTNLVH